VIGPASIEVATLSASAGAQRRVVHCMGTVFTIDVRAPGCEPAVVDEVIRWLHWVDAVFSTYRPDSPISRLGRGEPLRSDPKAAVAIEEILNRCQELEVETSGYFSAYANGQLDPSGLVKGWAGQRASDLLAAAGSSNHCVNGGGDVQCRGRARPGANWRIGVSDPFDRTQLAAVISGGAAELAIATSGSAERGNHIRNPHDALGLAASPSACPVSVTLVGRGLSTTDAYATAAFAMGAAAPAWIKDLPGYCGFVIFADGSRWRSPAFAAQP
jgi:thiamine biosynthesis lipoprotein